MGPPSMVFLILIGRRGWADPVSSHGLKANSIASLDDLRTRLNGIQSFKKLREERNIIYNQIKEDYGLLVIV